LFEIDPHARMVMGSHLAYSVVLYAELEAGVVSLRRLAQVSTWVDVAFGVAIALVTEGATSPFSTFFAFAVITAGLRSGLRATLGVTAISVVLYLILILVSGPEGETRYLMRPAYIAITGYLAGYLGQQRLNQDARIRELEANSQRERIARSLHDGYAQALSGVNLRLETCRELFRRGQHDAVLTELTDLQAGVNREHDELREYIRSLLDKDATRVPDEQEDGTQFSVRTDFRGTAGFVEQVLQIMLEGTRNVRRHAHARSAVLGVGNADGELVVTIDDDGVGFPDPAIPPWSIASRVAELGGRLDVRRDGRPGGHLMIHLPEA
jgi:signal transduction histidine kinase